MEKNKERFKQAMDTLCTEAKNTYKAITAYKFSPINKDTISLLVQGKLYFSNIEALNDPIECLLLYELKYNEMFTDTYQPHVLSLVVPSPIHTKKEHEIYMDLVDNTLMFSHYADSHKGIAIEYQIETELLRQADMFYTPVQYSTNTRPNNLKNFFAIKDIRWQYENEARFIVFDKAQSNIRGNIYKGGQVTKIIFGLKTPQEDKQLLYYLLHAQPKQHLKDIEFFETTNKNKSLFTLEFSLYKPETNN